MPARSRRGALVNGQACLREQSRSPCRTWPCPSSTIKTACSASKRRRVARDGAIGIQAVGAAIERAVADRGRAPPVRARDLVASRYRADLTRSRSNGPRSAAPKSQHDEMRTRRRSRCRCALLRAMLERLDADVGADRRPRSAIPTTARASSAPEPVPMSSMRSFSCLQAAASSASRAPPRPRFRFPAAAPARRV